MKIVYIIGAARSGTTLLDIILGNAQNILSAGEINRFAKRDGIPHNARDEEVGCFWKHIKNDFISTFSKHPREFYSMLRKFEYHLASYKLIIPNGQKQLFKEYANYQMGLFSIIEKTSHSHYNKHIIVDSSKYPMRALLLGKIFGNEICFIHLKRNPSAIIESFRKKQVEQPSKSRTKANLYLLFINAITVPIIKRLQKTHDVCLVTFEDLVASPVDTINKIETKLKLDLRNCKKLIEKDLPFKVGPLFDGNRLRCEKEIKFKRTDPKVIRRKIVDVFFYPFHKLISNRITSKS